MKCAISHPNIAPYIKQSVLAYQEHGVLDQFYTTYFEHPQYPLTQKLIKLFPKFEKEFKRRNISEINYELISGFPYQEMLRVLSARMLSPKLMNRIWEWSELNFDQWVSGQVNKQLSWVHTYEHAALATIKQAKRSGITSFHEQPSQHHCFFDQVLQDQLKKYPELTSGSIKLLNDENALRSNERKDEELRLCDYIICNSTFTQKTLISSGIDAQQIIRIPYGFPEVELKEPVNASVGKTRFLYAGSQSVRKGVHLLFQAWKRCNFDSDKAELIVIGKNQLPKSVRQGLPDSVKFIDNIPHHELADFYRQTDVFVLPTLADGFGMVISEAMAMGVPVICTMNSGGPDIIEHLQNGMLIPAGDMEALAAQMSWCTQNPQQLKEMAAKSTETAQSYPWSMFRKKLLEEVLSRVK